MKLTSLSASRIKCYKHCPFKYYMQYVLNLDLGSNWGAHHGSACHNVLEKYAQGDRDWYSNLIHEYTKPLVDKRRGGTPITIGAHTGKEYPEGTRLLHHAKPDDYLNVKKQCDKCSMFDKETGHCTIEGIPAVDTEGCGRLLFGDKKGKMRQGASYRIFKDHLENMGYIYDLPRPHTDQHKGHDGVEVEFLLECAPGKLVRGFIDFLYIEDGVLHMQDYKTSKKWEDSQNYQAIKDDIQSRIYAWAMKKLFPEFEVQMLTFNFFCNRPITVNYNDAEIEKTRQYLSNIWDEISGFHEKDLYRIYDKSSFTPNICKNLCNLTECQKQHNIWKKKQK